MQQGLQCAAGGIEVVNSSARIAEGRGDYRIQNMLWIKLRVQLIGIRNGFSGQSKVLRVEHGVESDRQSARQNDSVINWNVIECIKSESPICQPEMSTGQLNCFRFVDLPRMPLENQQVMGNLRTKKGTFLCLQNDFTTCRRTLY